jgi:hypothetical protein
MNQGTSGRMFDGKANGAKQQSEGNLQLNLNAKSRN